MRSSHNNVSKLCSQLLHVLPHVALHCSNLEAHDLSDCDIVYMASTVFDEALLARFAQRAAEQLRRGCRVVTLAEPPESSSFRTEAVVPCTNSWGRRGRLRERKDMTHPEAEPDVARSAASVPVL